MIARLIEAVQRIARVLGKAVKVWLWKRTIHSKADWHNIDGLLIARAWVSASPELLDGLKGDETQGEAVAQRMAEDAHARMLALVRMRMEIGRYASPE